jgi:hypothetical protein
VRSTLSVRTSRPDCCAGINTLHRDGKTPGDEADALFDAVSAMFEGPTVVVIDAVEECLPEQRWTRWKASGL